MSLQKGLKVQKPERAVISHVAETSGFRESAGSQKPNAVIARTVILSPLTIPSSGAICWVRNRKSNHPVISS
jgi:hypothetical protein